MVRGTAVVGLFSLVACGSGGGASRAPDRGPDCDAVARHMVRLAERDNGAPASPELANGMRAEFDRQCRQTPWSLSRRKCLFSAQTQDATVNCPRADLDRRDEGRAMVSRQNDDTPNGSCLLAFPKGGYNVPGIISPYGSEHGALGFGQRHSLHSGVDWIANRGDVAIAAAPGRVDLVHVSEHFGTVVVLFHPQLGAHSAYAHLERAHVSEKQEVTRGQTLGTVGLFEESGGMIHLHWETCTGPCNGEFSRTTNPHADQLECFESSKRVPSTVFTVPLRCCPLSSGNNTNAQPQSDTAGS